jgi:alkylhydroperoxidase/carboxymuconolactone decarboxylase family protein YurZ
MEEEKNKDKEAFPEDVKRGYSFPEFELLEKYDSEYHAARRHMRQAIYTPTDPLIPVKMREIIAAAVLAYRAYPSIEQHLRRAYREGASMRELIEAMECAAQPGGGPTLSYALKHLSKIGPTSRQEDPFELGERIVLTLPARASA